MQRKPFELLKKTTLTNKDVHDYLKASVDIDTPRRIAGVRDANLQHSLEIQENINEHIFRKIFLDALLGCNGGVENDLIDDPASPISEQTFYYIRQFLKTHWQMIRHAPQLHYHYRPDLFINKVCVQLALLCAKGLGVSCTSLLYPDLLCERNDDTDFCIIDESLLPGSTPLKPNVVISECGKYFIEIDICIERFVKSGELRHTQKEEALSPAEIKTVLEHNRFAERTYHAVKEHQQYRTESPTVGACIAMLIKTLRDGGAHRDSLKHRTGDEANEGVQADIGVLAFFAVIDALPEETLKQLKAMRCKNHDFEYHMRCVSDREYQKTLSEIQTRVNDRPDVKACQQAFHEQPAAKDGENKKLEAIKIKLSQEDQQLWKEYREHLKKYTAQCVETTSNNLEKFLEINRNALYNMTIDKSAGVSAQLTTVEERVNDNLKDLYAYLETLYPFIFANRKTREKQYRHFRADCFNKSDELIYADYIMQWLADTSNEWGDLSQKLCNLSRIVSHAPHALLNTDLLAFMPKNMLELFMRNADITTFSSIIELITEDDDERNDDGSKCRSLLSACDSIARNKWERDPDRAITNLARLLFAKPNYQPMIACEGYDLIQFALERKHVELLKFLVEQGASVELKDRRHLILDAIAKKHLDSTKVLIATVKEFSLAIFESSLEHFNAGICKLIVDRFITLEANKLELAQISFDHAIDKLNSDVLDFSIELGAGCDFNKAIKLLCKLLWRTCFSTFIAPVHQDQARYRESLQHTLFHSKAKRTLTTVLMIQLANTEAIKEITDNLAQWALKSIDIEAFGQVILENKNHPKLYSHLLYLANIMTDEQRKYIMNHFFDNGFKTKLKFVLPEWCHGYINGNKWDDLLWTIFITKREIPMRYAITFLLVHHPNINLNKAKILPLTVIDHASLFDYLIELPNIDINQVDEEGYTLVMRVAMTRKRLTTFKKLVAMKANLFDVSKDGNNLLHCAARNSLQMVAYLLENEISLPEYTTARKLEMLLAKNKDGESALSVIFNLINKDHEAAKPVMVLLQNILGQDRLFRHSIKELFVHGIRYAFDERNSLSEEEALETLFNGYIKRLAKGIKDTDATPILVELNKHYHLTDKLCAGVEPIQIEALFRLIPFPLFRLAISKRVINRDERMQIIKALMDCAKWMTREQATWIFKRFDNDIKVLFDIGADEQLTQEEIIYRILRTEKASWVEFALAVIPDAADIIQRISPLQLAVIHGHYEKLVGLLEQGNFCVTESLMQLAKDGKYPQRENILAQLSLHLLMGFMKSLDDSPPRKLFSSLFVVSNAEKTRRHKLRYIVRDLLSRVKFYIETKEFETIDFVSAISVYARRGGIPPEQLLDKDFSAVLCLILGNPDHASSIRVVSNGNGKKV